MVHYDNALSPLYNADGTLVQAYPQYAGMDYNDLKSKMEDGGNVDEDYYRVFRNNAGKDIAVKIVKNPIFGNFDYYVDGSLRGSFDTFEQARKEVNYENFDMYKDGGSIENGNYAFVEAETTTGKKVFKFFEDVPTHKEIYAYFRSIKDENGNPITLKDATIHIEKVSNFDRELFLEKANEIAIKQFGSPIEEIEDLMFAYDKENLSVFKFEAELENGMEVSIEATDGVIIIEAEKDEDDDSYKDGGTIYSKDESMNIAQTILSQMGGRRRLEAFTGAYNFAVGDGSVMFRIKNRKVNVVKVKLNGSDLYDVTFGRISGTNYKVVEELKDVYAEDLIDLFERETGMYLRMEKGGNLYDSEFYENGGEVDFSVSKDTKYFRPDDIIEIRFNDGKKIFNGNKYFANANPAGEALDNVFSGLYVANRPIPSNQSKEQYEMFKDGGNLPASAKYIKRSEIESVIIEDENGEEKEIPANRIVNGIWYDNRRNEELIERARKEGLLPKK